VLLIVLLFVTLISSPCFCPSLFSFLRAEFTEEESKAGEVDVTPAVMAACSGGAAPWLVVKEALDQGITSLDVVKSIAGGARVPRLELRSLRTLDSFRLGDEQADASAVVSPRRRLVGVTSRQNVLSGAADRSSSSIVTAATAVASVPAAAASSADSGAAPLPIVTPAPGASVYYPAFFPRSFHDALRRLDASDAAATEALRRAYSREVTVLLVKVFLPQDDLLLNYMAARTAAHALVVAAAAAGGGAVHEVSYVVILSTPPTGPAGVTLASSIAQTLHSHGYTANIGVCRGEVLAFGSDTPGAPGTIAGSPINVASKLAEDTEDRGRLFFEASVADVAGPSYRAAGEAFSVLKSGVEIRGLHAPCAAAAAALPLLAPPLAAASAESRSVSNGEGAKGDKPAAVGSSGCCHCVCQ
jgi:hypothetical protein